MPACILDARLALAPGGLLLAVRLARVMQVWLTREFWSLIDSAFVLPLNGPKDTLHELHLWHSAWVAGNLQGAFHWVGDARRESALPENTDNDLLARFEYLDEALLQATEAHGKCFLGRLAECGRQSLALA